MKNKVTTQGYFIKRLRDSNFIVIKIFDAYPIHDPRRWTVMVDPGGQSLFVTCYENKDFRGDIVFEFNDGGNRFLKNYNLKTSSMEIIITTLVEKGITQKDENCSFQKKD